jgi:hypothetical protein
MLFITEFKLRVDIYGINSASKMLYAFSDVPPSLGATELLGNNSVLDPPDPIPNSEVKRNCADDSVGSPHVKVGHCQALI